MLPNVLALGMLAIWPLIAMLIFTRRQRDQAIIIAVIAAYLFLPPRFGFDLPMLPPLSKDRLSILSVIICLILFQPRGETKTPFNFYILAIGIGLMASVMATHLTNADALTIGRTRLPALSAGTALPEMMIVALLIAPFYVGYRYLGDKNSLRFLLIALLVCGLAYSLFVLVEVRLSPQINRWFYGYHQHSFLQHKRGDGYRPIVFLAHGLWVAFFMASTLIAGAALWRQGRLDWATKDPEARVKWRAPGTLAVYLAVILYLCKSVASLVYGVGAALLILVASPRVQLRVALVLVVLSVAYPVMRANGLVPVATMVNIAASVDKQRSRSLNYRFEHEDNLLNRARERAAFGWGSYGRNRAYNQWGHDTSVSDGYWVLQLGRHGYVGFFLIFGLLALPVVLAQKVREPDFIVSGVAMVHAANMVDLLPNATITPITWLTAGALTAYALNERRAAAAPAPQPAAAPLAPPRRRTVL